MGQKWDYDVPSVDVWKECYRVLKPGGHLLSFSGSRTYHRMAVNVEDAGFEIRDQIMWVYGSGFPKSLNIGKAIDKKLGNEREVVGKYKQTIPKITPWQNVDRFESKNIQTKGSSEYEGWGTALKPAHEPIVLARKPFRGDVASNVLEHGTGALNIDGCRVGDEEIIQRQKDMTAYHGNNFGPNNQVKSNGKTTTSIGRWPANFIHDGLEEEWSKYFYCAKANKKDRNEGVNIWQKQDLKLELMEINQLIKDTSEDILMENSVWNTIMFGNNITEQYQKDLTFIISMVLKLITDWKIYNVSQNLNIKEYIQDVSKQFQENGLNLVENAEQIKILKQNTTGEKMELVLGVSLVVLKMLLKIKEIENRTSTHPTVKPTELMRYLCRLITPKNGTVLDPFMGSGSTGKAAILEGFSFIGVELSEEYLEIAKNRIKLFLLLKNANDKTS